MAFTPPVWLGAGLFLIGIVGFFWRNQISNMVAQVGSPLGLKVKHTLLILGIIGIVLGGFGTVWGFVSGLGSTASGIGGIGTDDVVSTDKGLLDCKWTTAPTENNVTGSAITFRADTKDNSIYYADVGYTNGADNIQGYLLCENERINIRQGVIFDCYVKADSYKSETDTTDSNTYYIVGLNSVASDVSGVPWQQNIFLGDEGTTAQASGSGDGYETQKLVYAQDEATQYLGFNLTLAGNTALNYLNNQTRNDVTFYCDDVQVGKLGIVKTSTI